MKLIDAKGFQPKPGDHWLDITEGMSGHFVVEMWLHPIHEGGEEGFYEPYDTPSRARWATAKEAWEEAKSIAKDSEEGAGPIVLPLINHPELESAKPPKSDYDKWLDKMDSHRPDWAYEFATQEETRDLFYTLIKGYRNAETAQARLRERVGMRLFVAVKAWVSLEICPICGDEVLLAQRRRADNAAKKESSVGIDSPELASHPKAQENAASWPAAARGVTRAGAKGSKGKA